MRDRGSTISPTPAPTTMAEENTSAGQPDPAQLMLIFAARARADHEAISYYGAILAAILGLFIIFHLCQISRKRFPSVLVGAFALPTRFIKRTMNSPGLAVSSVGHALISAGYFAINVIFIFIHSDYNTMPMQAVIAARTGWLALANICFTVFLSLRNTPLAYLTPWSYERLKFLHGIAGFTIVTHVTIHGACYSAMFLQQNNAARLRVLDEIYGIAAGFMLLSMAIAAVLVRQMSYELFYILHVTFFILGLVFISLHHSDIAEKVVIVVALSAGMWLIDHGIRLVRLGFYSINNAATVYPLANGGTKVILSKGSATALSGQHTYLWIPRIRLLETHPFTIAATGPLEFVISSHDGFTRDLHRYAQEKPGANLFASLQGSYGTMPHAAKYDRVVLIAGGSGGSFVVGVALNLIKALNRSHRQKITLVWAVKSSASLEWFATHLQRIVQVPGFSVSIHITNETPPSHRFAQQPSSIRYSNYQGEGESRRDSGVNDSDVGGPRRKEESSDHLSGLAITYGRPDVSGVIRQAIDDSNPQERILVMGCGPHKLMHEVRKAASTGVRLRGPAVDLHCEQFGW